MQIQITQNYAKYYERINVGRIMWYNMDVLQNID